MSFSELRPYFRARIKTVGELHEWKGRLETDNIPATILNKAFHITIGPFGQIKQNQTCLDSTGTATIRLFSKGHKDPQTAIDWLIVKGEAIVKESLMAKNRCTQPGIKNVKLTNFALQPFSPTDDSDVELTLDFEITLVTEIET